MPSSQASYGFQACNQLNHADAILREHLQCLYRQRQKIENVKVANETFDGCSVAMIRNDDSSLKEIEIPPDESFILEATVPNRQGFVSFSLYTLYTH